MFKLFVLFAVIAMTLATPEAKADPKAKPQLLAAAYSAPLVTSPAVAYSAPLAYSAGYVAPSVYTAGYSAYSPYAAPLVVV